MGKFASAGIWENYTLSQIMLNCSYDMASIAFLSIWSLVHMVSAWNSS